MAKNILDSIFNTQNHLSEDELNTYLGNGASPDLRRKVENAMLDNPLIADAVDGYEENGLSALPTFESFSDFKKKLPQAEGAKVVHMNQSRRMAWMVAAASVVVLAAVSLFFLQTPSPQSLYSDYYTHYENDISLARRGDIEDMHPNFVNALGNYATKKFDVAIVDFEKALAAEPDNDAAHYFAGLAFLEKDDTENALKHLMVVKENNGIYGRKAFWYCIMAHLKKGDVDSAKGMLNEFAKSPGYMQKEAKKLLSKF